MLSSLMMLALLVAPQSAEAPGASYAIRARLEDPSLRLSGAETLRWTNRTDASTDELWFHLYLNAFSNNRSTHLIESRGSLRGTEVGDEWGWQRVTSVRVGGQELLSSLRYHAQDDGNPADRSVASVTLSESLDPGEAIEVEVEWESELPRLRRRTGKKGDFLFVAQWFPKLGVFEGTRGWNCHQFHASTEFYSSFGTYDVELDLPARFAGKIFASGRLASSEVRGERVVVRFSAPTLADRQLQDRTGRPLFVHDFAWTADPRYEVHTETFRSLEWRQRFAADVADAQRALGPSKDLSLRDVDVTVLIHPERSSQWRRHFEAACAALFFYGLWWGEYPYEHLTVVDPAWGGGAAGGMEYPTLFTSGTQLFSTQDMHTPEGVTVHECGHQFWYGLVANNEFEAAWMDEGFNTYSTAETMRRAFGARRDTTEYCGVPFDGAAPLSGLGGNELADLLAVQDLGWTGLDWQPLRARGFLAWWRDQPLLTLAPQRSDPTRSARNRFLEDPDRDPMDTPAWRYADSLGYRVNAYNKPAVVLKSLAAAIECEHPGERGWDRFLAGMRSYSEAWRTEHPYPDDFIAGFNAGSGFDLSWYFDQTLRSTATVDWRVDVEQRRQSAERGYFQDEVGGEFVQRAAGEPGDWIAQVIVARRGALVLPVPLRLTFEDQSTETVMWTRAEQASSAYLKLERRGQKLVAAEVDPARGYELELDRSNNAWFDAVDELAPRRWSERVWSRYAALFFAQAGIGG